MRRNTKWAIGVGVLAVVAVVLWGFSQGSTTIHDGDLMPVRVAVPGDQNGFELLRELSFKVSRPPGTGIYTLTTSTNWQTNAISQLLQSNEEALALFEKFIQRPRLQKPASIAPGQLVDVLMAARNIAIVKSVQAESMAHEGKPQEGMSEALKILKLGKRLETAGSPGFSMLVTIAVEAIGLRAIERVGASANLPEETARHALDALLATPPMSSNSSNMFKSEYAWSVMLLEADQLATGVTNAASWMGINKPKSRKKLAELTRETLVCVPLPLKDMVFVNQPLPNQAQLVRTRIASFASGNVEGEIYLDTQAIFLKSVLKKQCTIDTQFNAVKLLLALRLYKMQHGSLPKSLDALVPDYLPAIPRDMFDGKPLRYLPDKSLIYSIGEDLTDDGGKTVESSQFRPDVPYKIEF